MSQEKVDKYKKEKANRKQIMKREKLNRILGYTAAIIVGVAIIGWVGYSIYDNHKNSTGEDAAVAQTEVNLDAIQDYISSLTAEEDADANGGTSADDDADGDTSTDANNDASADDDADADADNGTSATDDTDGDTSTDANNDASADADANTDADNGTSETNNADTDADSNTDAQ